MMKKMMKLNPMMMKMMKLNPKKIMKKMRLYLMKMKIMMKLKLFPKSIKNQKVVMMVITLQTPKPK
jgi:hypothetical protein